MESNVPSAADGSAGAAGETSPAGGSAGEQSSGGRTTAGAAGDGDTSGAGGATEPGAGGAAGDGAGGSSDDGAGGSSGDGAGGSSGDDARDGCDLEQDFGEPLVVPFQQSRDRSDGRLTADEKTIYFHADQGIWKAHWSEKNARFEDEAAVVAQDDIDEMSPSITDDGLELYYLVLDHSPNVPEPDPRIGINVSRRQTIQDDFQPGELVPNLPEKNGSPFIAPDGNTLYFVVEWKILAIKKIAGVFANAKPVVINAPGSAYQMLPTVSADEKTMLYGSIANVAGNESWWIHIATRDNVAAAFSGGRLIPSLVKANTQNQPHWISRDGCRVYFHRYEDSRNTLWMAARPALR